MIGLFQLTQEKSWYRWVAVAILVVMQSWVTLSHEAWLDEWQALLLAVQSPNLQALSDNLRYEGHPPLWYLFLRVVHIVFTSEWTLKLTALTVAVGTMLIIQLRAPFALIDRVLLSLSYLLLVEYGSLSRGISLGVMLMFLFVAARSKWLRWGILILFPLIEVQFAVLSVAGTAMMWRERQWDWRAAALWVLAMLAMVALVWPASDVLTAVSMKPTYFMRIALFLLMFGNLLVPFPVIDGSISWVGNAPGLSGLLFALIFLVMAVQETRHDRWQQLVFVGFFGFTLFMATFVYQLSIRHAGLVAILMIVLVWQTAQKGIPVSLYFRLWLLVSAGCGLFLSAHIDRVGFDSSGKAAGFIRGKGLQNELWASFNDAHAVPVTARLNVPHINMKKQCLQTFIRWDRKITYASAAEVEAVLRRTAENYGPFYLISAGKFEDDNESKAILPILQPITSIKSGYTGGAYYLYRVGASYPRTNRKPPKCKPLDQYPA